jgi:hypothetical protein
LTDYLKTTHHTIAWLKDRFDDDELDLAPVFQRNPVWTDSQKAFLMDSVLKGMPIPEIYMQETVDENGDQQQIVIDGQQRIRACLEFLEGEFTLSSSKTPEFAEMTFDDLPAAEKKRIFGYIFLTRVLPDMPRDEVRAIFTRLNRNVVALNSQELRHATYWGPFLRQMEDLAEDEFWGRSGVFSANDVRRMLDVEFISELTIGLLHGPQNKKTSLERWYQMYEAEYAERSRVGRSFKHVLSEIDVLLPDLASTRWSKKSDFYSLFLLLANNEACLPLSRGGRQEAQNGLRVLGEKVDAFLADPEEKVPKNAKRYAAAVERAATDLANRRSRAAVLEEVFKSIWSA